MAKTNPAPKATDETIKETFESIVIAFILAFIFRAYVVEAFIIPTGSMAPTLLGRHFEVDCEQCGYHFSIDDGGHLDNRGRSAKGHSAPCPMCKFPQSLPAGTPARSGDRLLVQKYLYNIAEPHRWDIVVFRNPQTHNDDGSPGPKTNYIKRLAGLPNESLYLIDGNVYVKPYDDADAPWRIARKTDPDENRHWEKIQRSVWQPIYHSQYVPLDHGLAPLSVGEDGRREALTQRGLDAWVNPWHAVPQDDSRWDLGDDQNGWRRSYTFAFGEDTAYGSGVGELVFDWKGYHDRGTVYPYNELTGSGVYGRQPIEDVRVAATITPNGSIPQVEIQTTARLESKTETLIARLADDGKVTLLRKENNHESVIGQSQSAHPFKFGVASTLELWFVDQEALVWVDGDVALRHRFDVPMRLVKERPPPADRPGIAIRVSGGPVTLSNVEVDRDISYTPSLSGRDPIAMLGTTYRPANGKLVITTPLDIRDQRYFVLGDNSPISNDGRFWLDVEPWIERNMFAEEFRMPQPNESHRGPPPYAQVVPRGLMVGRAFFIYFPAPYAARPGGRQVLPNFGDMRFVH